MHARYYNPNLGRFLSVDPVGGEVGSSQSWNRYSYTANNPLVFLDPDGEMKMRAVDVSVFKGERAWAGTGDYVYEIDFETESDTAKEFIIKASKGIGGAWKKLVGAGSSAEGASGTAQRLAGGWIESYDDQFPGNTAKRREFESHVQRLFEKDAGAYRDSYGRYTKGGLKKLKVTIWSTALMLGYSPRQIHRIMKVYDLERMAEEAETVLVKKTTADDGKNEDR